LISLFSFSIHFYTVLRLAFYFYLIYLWLFLASIRHQKFTDASLCPSFLLLLFMSFSNCSLNSTFYF
jgi:hypothetical protein